MQLPDLPTGHTIGCGIFNGKQLFTADQMIAYGAAYAEGLRADLADISRLYQLHKHDSDRLRRALHDIAEEWAGAECGEPVHAQEAYAIGLAKRMYSLAAEALKP